MEKTEGSSDTRRQIHQLKLSIVTPFYHEEEGIEEYFNTVIPILESMSLRDYEIICIDDGSLKDRTFELLKSQREQNQRIKIVKFSRNFGKELALTAGLDYATGDVVIPIDADLQDPPALFPQMIAKYLEGYDVVLMKRQTRDEGWRKNLTAKLFYRLINRLTNSQIPENIGDFRLMDRRVVDVIKELRERNRFMKGLLSWGGFHTTTLLFDRPEREMGVPKQNYQKLFSLAFDGIFSFSSLPLRIWTFLGVLISLFAFLFGIWVVIKKLIYGDPVQGYSSLMTIILFFNGLVMLSVGMLGEYISRIFDEVKNRPLYVVSEELTDD